MAEPALAETPNIGGTAVCPVLIEESTPARLTVRQVRDVYSRLAPLYGLWQKLAQGRSQKAALELADVRNGDRVLEVAVGPGTALESLARSNPAGVTIGMDLTPAMVERARRRLQRGSLTRPALCQCDARFLPFANQSFDLVLASYLLDLLSTADIASAVAEMRRVLRPAGRLVLVHLSRGNLWFDRLWGFLYWLAPEMLGGSRPIQLAAYLPSAGFTVAASRRMVRWGIPAEVILARRTP